MFSSYRAVKNQNVNGVEGNKVNFLTRTKHKNTVCVCVCGQSVEYLMLNLVVHEVITGL